MDVNGFSGTGGGHSAPKGFSVESAARVGLTGKMSRLEPANTVWHETLDRFTAPPRDPAIIEALTSFVDRRKAEGGAAPVS